jgi:hypothetical protein
MPNVVRIKRRATGGATGAPASLAVGEPAYSEVDNILYIGITGGTVLAMGGTGAFCTLTSAQTISGAKTFSSTVALGSSATAATPTTADNSTAVATTAFVKAQAYLTANQSITVSGDVTGTGSSAITATIAAGVVTNAKLATVATSTIKGRVSAGTGSPEDLTAAQVKTLLALVAADISNFDTQVRANPMNLHAVPTGDVSMNSFKLTNLAAPLTANDAARKADVDAAAQGLDVKASVRAATTANITLSGTQTIDGVVLVAGDRVLVKNQTTASGNGIYLVAAGAWTRATDADTSAKVTTGMFTFVEEGTTNVTSAWVLATTGAITLGTTNLTFNQFGTSGVPGSYTGQTTITTLGTITTGTWTATDIAVPHGGTGVSTLTGIVKGNGTSPFTAAVAGTDFHDTNSTIDGGTF